jgi:uncharacterized protein involved in exopolysaccharide biosynthesis
LKNLDDSEKQEQDSSRQRTAMYPETFTDEIDLRELFFTLWNGKWIIIAVTAVFAVASVIIALLLPNIYRAEALLSPAAQQEQSSGLSSLAGQFGGLASLAGINLGSTSTVDKTTLALETIKSRQFLSRFIQDHDVLVPLFATEKWNLEGNELVIDDDIYDPETGQWVRDVDPPKTPTPSLQDTHKEFNEILAVSQEADSGLVRIAIEHKSPYLAAQWVSWLVQDVNNYMKQTDITEARKSIEFLQRQLNTTSVADMQQVLYQLIQDQTQTIMLAEVRDEYVLKTIDPALPPEERASPNRALICIIGTLLGGMLACLFVLLRKAFNNA